MPNKLTRKAIVLRDALRRRPYAGDDFITWLGHATPGILDTGNLHSMDHAIRNLPSDHAVLEIGAFCGLSTSAITYLLAKHGRTNPLTTVDPWTFDVWEQDGTIGDSELTWTEYRDFIRGSFERNVAFFAGSRPPTAICMTSDELFERWDKDEVVTDVHGRTVQVGGPISFAYIDGNHEYEYGRRDFVNVDRHLDRGGWILFDDSSDDDPFGLTRLMKEVKADARYEMVARNPNYLFRKR